jgi:hypothetical protein
MGMIITYGTDLNGKPQTISQDKMTESELAEYNAKWAARENAWIEKVRNWDKLKPEERKLFDDNAVIYDREI